MDKNDKAPFNAYGSIVFTIGDLYKWFPGRTLTYSAAYGYFPILTPLKMIKNGHFRRLKLIAFL